MFGKLLKYELGLQFRQISFWVVVFLMVVLGVVLMAFDWASLSVEGGARIKNNGANTIASQIYNLTLAPIFFASVFIVTGIMRDDRFKFTEIMHSTPISDKDLILPRLIGAFVATCVCMFGAVIGLFIGQFMPWVDKETLGPIRPLYYIYPSLLYIVINSLLMAAFFALIAGLTRNRMIVYASAIGFLALNVAVGLATQDAPNWLMSIVDPFGATAAFKETEFWPADEQNTRLLPLYGNIGINRLVWGIISVGLFFATYKLFKRGVLGRKVKFVLKEEEKPDFNTLDLRPQNPTFSLGASLTSFTKRLNFEYSTTIKSIAFVILCGIALFLFGSTVMGDAFFETDRSLATSRKMANMGVGGFGLPILLVIIFFSGEIMWRDKQAGINEILDATPVRNWHLLFGKWVALSLVVLSLICFGLLCGLIVQILYGQAPVNISTYLKIGFISFAPTFLIYTALALFIQNFMPHRVVGMFATGLVLVFLNSFVGNLPFYHPLMGIGQIPTGSLSEINGYQSLINFRWYGLYNLLIVGFFAVASIWLWRRGLQQTLRHRFKTLGSKLTPVTSGLAVLSVVGAIFTGNHIHKAMDDADYKNEKAQEKQLVSYENHFREIEKKPVPKIRGVEVEANIRPSKGDAVFKGSYSVENTTGAPLTELYVVQTTADENVRALDVEGASYDPDTPQSKTIKEYDYRYYTFETPVPVGGTFEMNFDLYYPPSKLWDTSIIRRNGTFVNNGRVLPRFGITQNWLSDPDKRRKYELPELPKNADQSDDEARQFNFFNRSADYVDFKAKMCTDPGQIPIAPGHRIATEDVKIEGEMRHCRTYEAVNPIMNFYSFMSGDYEVKRDVWANPDGADIDLAIYHDVKHDYNVDLMMDAAKQALTTFTSTFGPYQYKQVRIMEFPYGAFAQAFAGTIPFSENIGFVRDPGDPDDIKSVDFASYVTMHEIGHQWFGHQIVPGETKGFNVLSEGLTENAALTAYEEKFGWKKARQVHEKRAIEGYLRARTGDRDDEPSLANAENQLYLAYQKSSWVFWGLKQYIGEDNMQSGIRAFLKEYGSKGPPYPTTHQLIEHLRAVAPADYQQLITDYWERITFWEMSLDDVEMTEKDGQFTVTLTAKVDKKIASEESGKETSVTEMDDEELSEWVEVAFYDQNPKKTLGGDWIKLERIRVTDLETAMSFKMDKKPTHVLIDPKRLLIERNVLDNAKKITSTDKGT